MIEHQNEAWKDSDCVGNKFLEKNILHEHISRLVENNQGRHNVVMIKINNVQETIYEN